MGFWTTKPNILFFRSLNSVDPQRKFSSRLVYSLAVVLIMFLLWLLYIRSPFHNNIYVLFLESLVFSLGFILFSLFLDWFTRDKFPILRCTKCFKTTKFEGTLKCICGGEYYDLWDFDYFESVDEKELLDPSTPITKKVTIRAKNYYQCLDKLPEIIFCPSCLDEIKLSSEQISQRLYFCNKCRIEHNFNIPKEFIVNNKVHDKYKYDLEFVQNGKLNVSKSYQLLVYFKIQDLEKYRELKYLTNKFKCPECSEKKNLSNIEINDRIIKCENCEFVSDIRYEN